MALGTPATQCKLKFCLVALRGGTFHWPLAVFGEFPKDFVTLRDYITRQRSYAYNEHFISSVNMAMSMFKLSITSRWALMAARGWARLILDRRRDLINDRPNCATAAEAPLDEAQERYHFDNPTAHTNSAYQRSEAA